ncbi:hypothetical protein M1N24_03125, partial [Dehalococcoidia bacterium]|nr:hypothetical protein [Dehalococcoidia bacterium]
MGQFVPGKVVPRVGLEPTHPCGQRILSSSAIVNPRFHTTTSARRLDRGQLGLNAPRLQRPIHKCQRIR